MKRCYNIVTSYPMGTEGVKLTAHSIKCQC